MLILHTQNSTVGIKICKCIANYISEQKTFPTALRAILSHYSETGSLSIASLRIQSTTDQFITETTESLYNSVEDEISARIDNAPDNVSFEYKTKLTLPAELTLGQVYYRAKQNTATEFDPIRRRVRTPILEYFRFPFDKKYETKRKNQLLREYSDILDIIGRAEEMTELVIASLIDGDMRDAINDSEYQDFQVDFPVDTSETWCAIAETAQKTVHNIVESRFAEFDQDTREAYEEAVKTSERHQERDQYFRDLAKRAKNNEDVAIKQIESEFKYPNTDPLPEIFDQSDLKLPYLLTQYRRVGVIYRGMMKMYRAVGIEIDQAFEKSIILSIIGAQIWLDDVDDYDADFKENQLTPVTAEYILHDDNVDAFRTVEKISKQYLDAAERHARLSNSPLAGIGSKYIYYSGNPSVLPQ